MIRDAVILAAGLGSRIRNGGSDLPKPLHPLNGSPLIEHTFGALAEAGIERTVVVVGFRAPSMVSALRPIAKRAGLEIEFAVTNDYRKSNGVSLLAARDHVDGDFVLSMSDHVYDPSVARRAIHADLVSADLVLCVDNRVNEVFDIDDATKVRTDGDRIVEIGKEIPSYDCIDCGVFAISPTFFEALADEFAERGDCSLSAGVQRLSKARRSAVADIGDAFWQDVDTPEALARASVELRRHGLHPSHAGISAELGVHASSNQ